jgi:transcriptional regulator with GAF, ATPase, and Fis domain
MEPGWEPDSDLPEALTDPNHWIPHGVLRTLIRLAENATGEKDVAYRAAVQYFSSPDRRSDSLFELVVRTLDDVRSVLVCSPLWAGAYTNYLKLQALFPSGSLPAESGRMILLAKFNHGVQPSPANLQFIRGNYEGFTRLYPFVRSARCTEEISQLRIEDLVSEFKEYRLEDDRDCLKILHHRRVAATAVRVPLRYETVEAAPPYSEEEPIVKLKEGIARLLVPSNQPGTEKEPTEWAYRIRQGGVLKEGRLSAALTAGAIYNAPYSRFRFEWTESPRPKPEEAVSADRLKIAASLLMDHLKSLKTAQQRLLGYMVSARELADQNLYLRERIEEGYGGMIGQSEPFQELCRVLRRVAASDSTVLLLGETGTGKELMARAIHRDSLRSAGPFVAVNCGAIPEPLLESELFGHERGAFTGAVGLRKGRFELAHRGTLFLDEIGELSPATQVKLLRVLQERTIQRIGGHEEIRLDVRVVAATHRDLLDLTKKGLFRSDLYYRLSVVPVSVPPLRDRAEDIPLLADHFLARYGQRYRKSLFEIPGVTVQRLQSYRWPGNVRELENVIERAVTLADPQQRVLTEDLLPSDLGRIETGSDHSHSEQREREGPQAPIEEAFDRFDWDSLRTSLEKAGSVEALLRRLEWRLAQCAIRKFNGNKSQAARALRRSYRWLRKLEQRMENQPL